MNSAKSEPVTEPSHIGFLDLAAPTRVSGWAMTSGDPAPVEVQIFVNGDELATLTCSGFRKGVQRQGRHPTGRCGFSLHLRRDQALPHGAEVRVFIAGTEFELTNSPRLVVDEVPESGKHETRRIFFMHIAKTAGSSLNTLIARHYPASRVQMHVENTEFREDRAYTQGFDFISGHVRAVEAMRRMDIEGFFWITLMREPLSHLVSHLCWVRRVADDESSAFFRRHPRGIRELALMLKSVDMGVPEELDHFLSRDDQRVTNLFHDCQTRYFLPPNQKGSLEQQSLVNAKKMLNKFDLVGTTENYAEFISSLCRKFGWEIPVAEERINANSNRYGIDVDDEATIKVLKRYTRMDKALYDYIAERG